jgi:uncharacterized protein YecT (DUF1311 family)
MIAAVVATTIVAAAPGRAEDQSKYSPAFQPCLDKANGVTTDMVNCIGIEIEVQDKRLNAAYKAAMAKQNSARKKELQNVQRLWVQYRDANCGFAFDPDGGTMAHIETTNCVLAMTEERADELEAIADR